jgi:hypothetical protein
MTQSYFHGSFQVKGHSNLFTLHGEVVVLIPMIRENPFGHKGMHYPKTYPITSQLAFSFAAMGVQLCHHL